MSTRISLYFKEFENHDLAEKGIVCSTIRLFGQLRLKTRVGWSDPYIAILDTGAPTCILPFRIWSECEVELLGDYVLRGVVPKEECSLPVLIGKVRCVLADNERESDELSIVAYLAFSNDIPLLIGFEGLLERAALTMNYSTGKAFLNIT